MVSFCFYSRRSRGRTHRVVIVYPRHIGYFFRTSATARCNRSRNPIGRARAVTVASSSYTVLSPFYLSSRFRVGYIVVAVRTSSLPPSGLFDCTQSSRQFEILWRSRLSARVTVVASLKAAADPWRGRGRRRVAPFPLGNFRPTNRYRTLRRRTFYLNYYCSVMIAVASFFASYCHGFIANS